MAFSDYIIYVDESGDHGLQPLDPEYPVFVLDFCIFRKDHYANVVVPGMQAFKFEFFGHDIAILHEHSIRRLIPPFTFLRSIKKRQLFMDGLNSLVSRSEFTIIGAVIKKGQLARTRTVPDNPYETALSFCMEGAWRFLLDHGQQERTTHIVVEGRGAREDRELGTAFRRIKDGANGIGEMPGFEIFFANKKTNSTGLQLADLTARPIGRHILDPLQPNRAWDIIEPKLYRAPPGGEDGFGLKVFP